MDDQETIRDQSRLVQLCVVDGVHEAEVIKARLEADGASAHVLPLSSNMTGAGVLPAPAEIHVLEDSVDEATAILGPEFADIASDQASAESAHQTRTRRPLAMYVMALILLAATVGGVIAAAVSLVQRVF